MATPTSSARRHQVSGMRRQICHALYRFLRARSPSRRSLTARPPASSTSALSLSSPCAPDDTGLLQTRVDCEHRRAWEIAMLYTEYSFLVYCILYLQIGLLNNHSIANALCCTCVLSLGCECTYWHRWWILIFKKEVDVSCYGWKTKKETICYIAIALWLLAIWCVRTDLITESGYGEYNVNQNCEHIEVRSTGIRT